MAAKNEAERSAAAEPAPEAAETPTKKERTRAEVIERIGRGEPLPSGWTFDPGIDPPVRKATPAELKAAEG